MIENHEVASSRIGIGSRGFSKLPLGRQYHDTISGIDCTLPIEYLEL